METYWIYPIYTTILAIILIAIVPRSGIKRLAVHSILLGGVVDFLILELFGYLINTNTYINYLPFGAGKISFFPPIAWTIWFILFFYLLPDNNILRYIYLAVAAAYSTFFSNVLINLNVIGWEYEKVFIPFFIYLVWFSAAIWIKGKLKES